MVVVMSLVRARYIVYSAAVIVKGVIFVAPS